MILATSPRIRIVQRLIPSGLRTKIATGYDMVQSTLDCGREWKGFTNSIREEGQFIHICHRLNIGLDTTPPKIDNVAKISGLEEHARAYFARHKGSYFNDKYRNAHDHVVVVARRLVACLFYFEEDPPTDNAGLAGTVNKRTGFLRCRLSPTMKAQFSSLIYSGPVFRVRRGDVIRAIKHEDPNPPHHRLLGSVTPFS
jgi:hypothetical protein